jgi:hypothetical protein
MAALKVTFHQTKGQTTKRVDHKKLLLDFLATERRQDGLRISYKGGRAHIYRGPSLKRILDSIS